MIYIKMDDLKVKPDQKFKKIEMMRVVSHLKSETFLFLFSMTRPVAKN